MCGATGELHNIHHHKSGPLFQCDDTPTPGPGLQGLYLEVEEPMEHTSRELMMCPACWGAQKAEGPEQGVRHAATILRRHWRLGDFPVLRSIVIPELQE